MQLNTAIAKSIIFALLLSVGLMISPDAHAKCPLSPYTIKGHVLGKNKNIADAKIFFEVQENYEKSTITNYILSTDTKGNFTGDYGYFTAQKYGFFGLDRCTYKPKTISIRVTHPGYEEFTSTDKLKDLFSQTVKVEHENFTKEVYRLPVIQLIPIK